ncbi:Os10g0479001, partial [Oryza sativa Japonica Group]
GTRPISASSFAFAASPLSHTCIAIAVIVRTKLCSASAPPPSCSPNKKTSISSHLICRSIDSLQGELNNGVRVDHLAAAPHPDHNRRGGSLHHLPLAEW